MKKLVVVAAIGVTIGLAACAEPATEEPVAEEEAMVEEPAMETAAMAADGMPTPGVYEVTLSNGDVWTETVNADGTYTSAGPTGESESGTWTQESPEVYCTTEEGAEEATCYDETMTEDGVWTSTEQGTEDTATVVRVS